VKEAFREGLGIQSGVAGNLSDRGLFFKFWGLG
jgi:hypothetical protein